MSSATLPKWITPEEYLELERKAETRSEYFNGRIYAMAGTTRPHNLITGNIHTEINFQFRRRPCEVYVADMRVLVNSTGLYSYPDVVAVCSDIRFEDARQDTLLNPTVIIEVLSSSTEAYDRGDKFAHYRRIESLQEYVLAAQDRMRVERFVRQDAQWVLTEISAPDSELVLASIDCSIPLNVIYDKVVFPTEEVGRGNLPPL